ncbi:MAG: hypothetical protein HOE92_04310 [Euryarchaeota archaeon]|nr:hypothetical protein [Euryarchaeota archaeon]
MHREGGAGTSQPQESFGDLANDFENPSTEFQQPVTCWVIDHPAHAQAFMPFIRNGNTADLFICCDRPDVRHLIESGEGILPRRQVLWVPRPTGIRMGKLKRLTIAYKRYKMVRRELQMRNGSSRQIMRIIGLGAPIELYAAKRSGIKARLYISDVEPDHLSHKWALKSATDILIPLCWRKDLDGGFSKKAENREEIEVHHFPGTKPHVYLRPITFSTSTSESSEVKILMRTLLGGGIHDEGEVIAIPDFSSSGIELKSHIEGARLDKPWELPNSILNFDGVITQSVSLASEAAVLGVPVFLISKAERGVLNWLEENGAPLSRLSNSADCKAELEAWINRQKELKNSKGGGSGESSESKAETVESMNTPLTSRQQEWPDTKASWGVVFELLSLKDSL